MGEIRPPLNLSLAALVTRFARERPPAVNPHVCWRRQLTPLASTMTSVRVSKLMRPIPPAEFAAPAERIERKFREETFNRRPFAFRRLKSRLQQMRDECMLQLARASRRDYLLSINRPSQHPLVYQCFI